MLLRQKICNTPTWVSQILSESSPPSQGNFSCPDPCILHALRYYMLYVYVACPGSWLRVFVLHLWSQRSHGAGLVQRVLRRCRWRLWGLAGLGQDHGLGPQCRGFELHPHAGCYQRLEGAHGVAGRAGAAADGRLGVGGGPQHDAVDGAEGLAGAGRGGTPAAAATAGVLPLLQGVQHHVRGVLGGALTLQLTQLVQSSVHSFFYVLQETERVSVREEGGYGGVIITLMRELSDRQEK